MHKLILAAGAAATVAAPATAMASTGGLSHTTAEPTSNAIHLCLTQIKHPNKHGPHFTFDVAAGCRPDQRAMTVHLLIGPRGPIGLIGPQGLQGVQGIQGLIGPMDPQGATGAQGPQGAPGRFRAAGSCRSVRLGLVVMDHVGQPGCGHRYCGRSAVDHWDDRR
jgi:hypothetical protein